MLNDWLWRPILCFKNFFIHLVNLNAMKKTLWLFACCALLAATSFKSDNLPSIFADRLNRAKMTFTPPDGFIEAPVIKNSQMHYEYALKDPSKDFEVRYAVAPLDSVFIQFDAMQKDGTTHMVVGPNQLYYGAFVSTMGNISNGTAHHVGPFPADAVKTEFNADWVASGFCEVAGDFGKGYKYCTAVAIHKDSLADAYYFYLGNNLSDFTPEHLIPIFHAMKFK